MKAKEILNKKEKIGTENVITIQQDATAYDTIARLDKFKIGSLLVVNEKNDLVGIVSERDILYKCYNSGVPLKEQKIKNLMTSKDQIIIGKVDDDSQYLMNVMTAKRIRHIPIIEEPEKLVGIVSIGDIIKAELESTETEAKLLREHIKNPFGVHLYQQEE
jgi:CBS-domain-containing membrane protein